MKIGFYIFLGGGLGSLLRYLVSKLIPLTKTGYPWPTLIANFLGCLIIGFLLGWALKNQSLRSDFYFFAAIGFCGGLTTFSTFSLENMAFLRSGDYLNFIRYVLLSVIGGLLFVVSGNLIYKFFN